jgi:hypothetical protein
MARPNGPRPPLESVAGLFVEGMRHNTLDQAYCLHMLANRAQRSKGALMASSHSTFLQNDVIRAMKAIRAAGNAVRQGRRGPSCGRRQINPDPTRWREE